MSVFQLLYASGASFDISADDIAAILAQSRRNNSGRGVTGVLLFANNTFIQVLEGEEAIVRRLGRTISEDRRHRNYMVLYEGAAESRAFASWEMGFKALDPTLPEDGTIFRATRDALEKRIAKNDGRMLLDTVLAFASGEFLADL